MIGFGVTPFSIRFQMVVSCLLVSLLWKYQANWGFSYLVDVVYGDGVYLTIIVLNLLFKHTLSSDIDYFCTTLNHPIIDVF